MAGIPGPEWSRGGGKGMGYHKCTGPCGGRVGAFRLEGTQERRRYRDVTGGRRGGRGVGSRREIVRWRLKDRPRIEP